MADDVGIAVAGAGDRSADLARDLARLPGSRLVALHDNEPRRLKDSAALHPATRQTTSLEEPAAARASLEQGGTPARPAPAGQEAS